MGPVLPEQLKSQTRSNRGTGIRRRVQVSTNLPKNWQQFLRDDTNKMELFAFLVEHISHLETIKQIVTTKGSEVVCIPPQDTTHLSPCDHEEADTRMILHLGDAFHKGFRKVLLRTVDTDMVVLSVAAVTKLDILWVAFGTGKNFRYIPVHEIVASIGPYKSQALPFFHAYTGCDSVSSFATRGKKSACDTWRAIEEVTTTFLAFSTGPDQVSNEDVAMLEWFTILLYDRTSELMSIGETSNTSEGLCAKVAIVGVRLSMFLLTCPLQRTGDGQTLMTGNPYGQLYLKLASHQESS